MRHGFEHQLKKLGIINHFNKSPRKARRALVLLKLIAKETAPKEFHSLGGKPSDLCGIQIDKPRMRLANRQFATDRKHRVDHVGNTFDSVE